MEHTVVAATTTVGIALLFVLCLLWRRLLVDIFRDRLFRLREQWFDLALDSESTIQFDSHLYRSVKHSLCTMLRNSRHVSFSLAVLIRIGERIQNIETDFDSTKWTTESINQIPDEYTRTRAVEIWTGIPTAIHRHMLRTSLVFALLTAIRFVSLSLRRRPTPER